MDLKKEISNILARALAGYKDDYKIKHTDGRVYVAWGAVERDIHAAVDAFAAAQQIIEDDLMEAFFKNVKS